MALLLSAKKQEESLKGISQNSQMNPTFLEEIKEAIRESASSQSQARTSEIEEV